MVGALFGARGQVILHHDGDDASFWAIPGKVRLFKHIQESLKYDRFDTKLLTGKYQLVLN